MGDDVFLGNIVFVPTPGRHRADAPLRVLGVKTQCNDGMAGPVNFRPGGGESRLLAGIKQHADGVFTERDASIFAIRTSLQLRHPQQHARHGRNPDSGGCSSLFP